MHRALQEPTFVNDKKAILFIFSQPWCGACTKLKASFMEEGEKLLDVSKNFLLVNVGGDDNNKFGVTTPLVWHIGLQISLPTFTWLSGPSMKCSHGKTNVSCMQTAVGDSYSIPHVVNCRRSLHLMGVTFRASSLPSQTGHCEQTSRTRVPKGSTSISTTA